MVRRDVLRSAAQAVLAGRDDTAGERADLSDAVAQLGAALARCRQLGAALAVARLKTG